MVNALARQRAILITNHDRSQMTPARDLAGGRLLFCTSAAESIPDGHVSAASQGFYNEDDLPPWDTWLYYIEPDKEVIGKGYQPEYLVSWAPRAWIDLVMTGVKEHFLYCMRWAEQTDLAFTRQLREAEMTITNQKFTFMWAFFILCFGNTSLQRQPAATQSSQASVLATWKGDSICVGSRPACKNEVVVYRFEAVAGKPDMVLQLADKIINGKRVPMGKLEFRYDKSKRELSCDFTLGQTHGLWQFKVTGESMEGALVLLPDNELVRRVNVKKVREDEVPMPPARESYDGV